MGATFTSGSHLMEHWLKITGTMAHELPERWLYFTVICMLLGSKATLPQKKALSGRSWG